MANIEYVAGIPTNELTEQLTINIVKRNGHLLSRIPEHLKTIDVCYTAVRSAGAAIQYVPSRLVNQELVDIAVAQNPKNTKYVVPEFTTFNQVYKIFTDKQIPLDKMFIKYPQYARQLADKAFKDHMNNIENIPVEFRTENMFRAILNGNYSSSLYKYVPKHMLKREHYTTSVFKWNEIPPEYLDEDMWAILLERDPMVHYSLIPENINTRKFKIKFLLKRHWKPANIKLPAEFFDDPLVLKVAIVRNFAIPAKYHNDPIFELISSITGHKRDYITTDAKEILSYHA